MEIAYAHLCDYATISQGGKVSLGGIFNEIHVASLPALHLQAFLAFEIELNYAEVGLSFDVRVNAMDADGAALFDLSARVTSTGVGRIGERSRFAQVLSLQSLRFVRAGAYSISVWLQGRLAHQLRFDVSIVGPEQRPDVAAVDLPALPGPDASTQPESPDAGGDAGR